MIFHGEPISGRFFLFLISKIIFVSSTHIYIYIRKEKIFRVKNNLVRFYTLVSGSPNPVSNQESVEVGPCIELKKCCTWTLNPAVSCEIRVMGVRSVSCDMSSFSCFNENVRSLY